MSEKKPCNVGVLQAYICYKLGPLLFLLYIDDLPQYVKNQNRNSFADDTIVYSFGHRLPPTAAFTNMV